MIKGVSWKHYSSSTHLLHISIITPLIQNHYLFILKILFIYSWETQREREEKQAPCRKPNVGLNPETPGSHPELKADAQPLSHPGTPKPLFIKII